MRHLLFIFLFFATHSLFAQLDYNCFGIIAGRNATKDGSVLFAHNEDDSGEQLLSVNICNGDASKGINKFLWAEFAGMQVADAFLNEYGVAIASDACSSREDRGDYTDGGILYNIRMDVAKYAHSARHAVELIGKKVERYGYKGSGRSYLVADPNEGWVVAIVQGRHWVAQRVADDEVMIIPNYYAITRVDLADTANFRGSADIVSYAVERGWYNPASDGEFSFRKAYASPKTLQSSHNCDRHPRVLSYFAGYEYDYNSLAAPFSIKPKQKVDVADMIDALSIHYPDTGKGLVCRDATVLTTVCQLRSWLPRPIGCIMWMTAGHPCSEGVVPWYLGMTQAPKGWQRCTTWQEAEQSHLNVARPLRQNFPNAAYWNHVDYWTNAGQKHLSHNDARRIEVRKKNAMLFARQDAFEKTLQKLTPAKLSKVLNKYTEKCYKEQRP